MPLALLSLVLMLVAFVPAADAKVPKDFYGIVLGSPTNATDMARMKKTKVDTARFLLAWNQVQPTKGVYNWPDSRIQLLAEHGIRPEPRLVGSPKWATGSNNPRKPPLKGKAKRGWKRFVKKAVKRYKPGGKFWDANPTLKEKPIKDWQVWNEPNLKKEFPPNASPRKYAKLLTTTDKVIRKADRRAKVIMAGISGATQKATRFQKFLRKFYDVRKIKKHFDAAAFHPYAPKKKELKARLKQFRKALKKGHDKKTPLWITEIGYGSGPKDRFRLNKGSEKGQANALKRAYKLILDKRKTWKIKRLDWFNWRDPVNPPADPFCSFCPYGGLIKPNDEAKLAYHAFKNFTKQK